MKKFALSLAFAAFATSALAQWQVPTNAIPFGRGSGTGFNSAAAAANSILATNGSSVPGLAQTLPTQVQDNITRLGTIVAGAVPFTVLTGRATLAQLPQAAGASQGSLLGRGNSAGDYVEQLCTTANTVWLSGTSGPNCGPITNAYVSASAAIAFSKFASLSANQVLGALTATTPSGLSVPSCSGAHNALNWTAGSGFGCATLPSATATADRYLKGNGTVWGTSSGPASGTGACGGGQFVTGLNSDAAPTCGTPSGSGDVIGPASATDNAAVRFDTTTGKLIQNSALIIDDTTGRISRSGNGGIPVQGINSSGTATAGDVGEVISSTVLVGSAINMPATATSTNITSISLTAGQWTVCGNVSWDVSQTATVSRIQASISAVSATMAYGIASYNLFDNASVANPGASTGCLFLNLNATTTYYLVAQGSYTVGAGQLRGYGHIFGVRAR